MADNSTTEVNLSMLGLPIGDHIITARAVAAGYLNSQSSNAVTYTVEPHSYTITPSIINGAYDGPVNIQEDSTSIVAIIPSAGYDFPRIVTVTGADYFYNRETGEIILSNPSAPISISTSCRPKIYNILNNIINGTYSGVPYIEYGDSATITISPAAGYSLPTNISVIGAVYTYDNITGEIVLTNPSDNVAISATCPVITYSITTTISNGSYSGASTIQTGGTASITLVANTNYVLPLSISVTGDGDYIYNSITGEIILSNPSGNVTISATCLLASQGLTFISNGDNTCYISGIGDCTDTNMVVPATSPRGDLVTGIGQEAFMDSSITGITLRDSITSIASGAFKSCGSLSSITIGNGSLLSSIGTSAFENCCDIHNISLPNNVKILSSWAFANCRDLRSITIGSGIEYIGNRVFSECASLSSITIYAEIPPILDGTDTFYGLDPNYLIFVPAESVAAYREAPVWSQIDDRIYSM